VAASAGAEPVEYQGQLVFRDAAAAIGDDQPHRRARLAPDDRQLYGIALSGMPDGIVSKRVECYAKPDNVRARIEVVAPHRGQQSSLGHRLPDVLSQFEQQQELQPGQRHRARPDVRDQPAHARRTMTVLSASGRAWPPGNA
jgi:hypothetical protein